MNNTPLIIVLNLSRNSEKRDFLEQQFKYLNIENYIFFPGIDSNYITNEILIKIAVGYGLGRSLTKTELAIIMGHINILSFALASNLNNIIILEDDVVLCDDFCQRIENILNELPDKWEYVYLSGHSDYVKFPIAAQQKIERAPLMVGAFSYMVNKCAYQKIINFCLSLMTTYDDLIMQMNSLKRLNAFVVFPFLSYIRDTYSENGKTMTINHSSKQYFKNIL